MSIFRIVTYFMLCTGFALAQLKPEFSYIGEFANNFQGGIKAGTTYEGLVNAKVTLNTESSHIWSGGEFCIAVINTHGGMPSQALFGDFQTCSNIQAGNITYLHEMWYHHTIADVDLTVGMQNVNAEFIVSENGGGFLNSSFGIPPTFSSNLPAPIFPHTALGATLQWKVNSAVLLQTALYNGLPSDDSHNLSWKISKDNGYLSIAEIQYTDSLISKLNRTFKIGLYYHSALIQMNQSNNRERSFEKRYGFYLNADQAIFDCGDEGSLNIFAQFCLSPQTELNQFLYAGSGFVYKGLFYTNDACGLAYAGCFFRSSKTTESVIELNYEIPLTEHIYLQPDMQYVINPGGTISSLQNTVAAILRFGCNY